MNLDALKARLQEVLRTTEAVATAAKHIDVSPATLYRYKANPEQLPLGKFIALVEHLGLPVAEHSVLLPPQFVDAERHRLSHERAIAAQGGKGERLSVTPFFPVTTEIPQITAHVAESTFGAPNRHQFPEYFAARAERVALYMQRRYNSIEIINAYCYRSFFNRSVDAEYAALTQNMRDSQVERLAETNQWDNVTRRIYFGHELPYITAYSDGSAIPRIDEFTLEVTGERMVTDLKSIFFKYFNACKVKARDDVTRFLQDPNLFFDT